MENNNLIETNQNQNQSIEDIRHFFLVMVRQFGLLQKESVQCCGVTTIQGHILYEIKHTHHMSLNELAERLGLDNSTTSRHVQGLVENGSVQRHPDPKDRRYVTLGLTKQGMAFEEEIHEMMRTCIINIFNQMPDGKIHTLSSDLKLLTEAMSKSNCCKS